MPTISKSNIDFDQRNLSDKTLLKLYYNMLKPRLIEEKMLILLRQGKISKWFSGISTLDFPVIPSHKVPVQRPCRL